MCTTKSIAGNHPRKPGYASQFFGHYLARSYAVSGIGETDWHSTTCTWLCLGNRWSFLACTTFDTRRYGCLGPNAQKDPTACVACPALQ
mmetsp:Transcript_32920/g.96955  ORF Transcript_32920/g.96955 Transcript_32920/m.96955 type:complete len:89 (+) Transcript_32920:2827-3093(+)